MWEESRQYIQHVKEEGIKQFLYVYNKHKHSRDTVLKWGDEVEYTAIWDDRQRKYRAGDVLGGKYDSEFDKKPERGPRWARDGAQDPPRGPNPPSDVVKASRNHLQPIFGATLGHLGPSANMHIRQHTHARHAPQKARRTRIKFRKIFLELSWAHLGSILAHLGANFRQLGNN